MSHAVLLVDDERFARTVYSDYLRAAGYDVEVADGSEAALAILAQRRFDVLLTDVILPGSRDGLELLDLAKQQDPNIGVIVITALDKVDPAVRAMKSGASDYLVKPVTPEALQLSVQRALATRALLAENQALRAHLKVFENGQRIVSSLDRDRLVPLALAAIASECASPAAALLERGADGAFVPAGAHGMEYAETADLLGMCGPVLESLDPFGPAVKTIAFAAPMGPQRTREAACLTVVDEGVLVGAVVVLGQGELAAPAAEGAAFLCRHLGIALKNLGRLKQVEHIAYLDDLTHLYNTRYLDVALERELSGGRAFTVLFMDLDHFKLVNDQHGHLSGSRLLVEVGRVLRSCVRVPASIGLASFPEHAQGKAEILDSADRAMYRGKRSTRNVVYMASKDLP